MYVRGHRSELVHQLARSSLKLCILEPWVAVIVHESHAPISLAAELQAAGLVLVLVQLVMPLVPLATMFAGLRIGSPGPTKAVTAVTNPSPMAEHEHLLRSGFCNFVGIASFVSLLKGLYDCYHSFS